MRRHLTPFVLSAFRLDPADLDMNRAGYLSDRQRNRLLRHHRERQLRLTVATWLTFVLSLGLAQPALDASDGVTRLLFSIAPLTGLGLSLYPLVTLLGERRRLRADIRDGVVEMTEGRITSAAHRSGDTVVYFVSVGTLIFRVSDEQRRGLRDYEAYRLYFTPHMQTLVAAEHLIS